MLLSSLATVLQESGRTSEALDVARAGIARLPDDAGVAENFVVAALCAGASAEALPVIEKFRARKPLDQRWITYRLDIARLAREEEFASWFDPARVVSVVDLASPSRVRDHRGISFSAGAAAASAAPPAKSSARPEPASWHTDLTQPARESRRGNRGPAAILPAGSRGHAGTFRPRCQPIHFMPGISRPPRSSAAGRCDCVVVDST